MPPTVSIRRSAAGLGMAALFGLAACGDTEQPADPPSNAPQTSAPETSPTAQSPSAAPTSAAPSSGTTSGTTPGTTSGTTQGNTVLLKAGATAEATGSGGQRLTSIESENADSRWEITLTDDDGTEYELDLAADGSQVQRGPTKQNDSAADLREQRAERAAASIDYREAVSAVGKAQAGRITELNLDTERGTVVWEANVVDGSGAERAVKINADSGALVSNTADD